LRSRGNVQHRTISHLRDDLLPAGCRGKPNLGIFPGLPLGANLKYSRSMLLFYGMIFFFSASYSI